MFKKKLKKPFICIYIGVEESLVTIFPAVFTFDSFLFVDIDRGSRLLLLN